MGSIVQLDGAGPLASAGCSETMCKRRGRSTVQIWSAALTVSGEVSPSMRDQLLVRVRNLVRGDGRRERAGRQLGVWLAVEKRTHDRRAGAGSGRALRLFPTGA